MQSVENDYRKREKCNPATSPAAMFTTFLDDNPIPAPEQRLNLYRELLPEITPHQPPCPAIILPTAIGSLSSPGRTMRMSPTFRKGECWRCSSTCHYPEAGHYVGQANDAHCWKNLQPQPISGREQLDSLGITALELSQWRKSHLKPTDFPERVEILMLSCQPGGIRFYGMGNLLQPRFQCSNDIQTRAGLVTVFHVPVLTEKMAVRGTKVLLPHINELFEVERQRRHGKPEPCCSLGLPLISPRHAIQPHSSHLSRQSVPSDMTTPLLLCGHQSRGQIPGT